MDLGERHSSLKLTGGESRLRALKERLCWQHEAAERTLTNSSGASLLFWAVMAGDLPSVREIVTHASSKKDLHRGLTASYPALSLFARTTPLMIAMCFSRWEVVEALLDAGADPTVTDVQRKDPLMWAAIYGNDVNIRGWLQRYSQWNLERREATLGLTALHFAVITGTDKRKAVEALLERGANPLAVAHNGAHLLGLAAINPDLSPDVVQWILDFADGKVRPLLQLGLRPRTLKWRGICAGARWLSRTGWWKSKMVNELACFEGLTPLHDAGRLGHHLISGVLVHNGAPLEARTAQGLTPRQISARFLGGAIPTVLEHVMSGRKQALEAGAEFRSPHILAEDE